MKVKFLLLICFGLTSSNRLRSTDLLAKPAAARFTLPNSPEIPEHGQRLTLRGGLASEEIVGAESAALRLKELQAGRNQEPEWTSLLMSCIKLAEAGDLSCARRAVEVMEAMAERGMRTPLESNDLYFGNGHPTHQSTYDRLFDVCERSRLLPEGLRLLALHERAAPKGELLSRADAVLGSVSSRLDERCSALDELVASRTLAEEDNWEV